MHILFDSIITQTTAKGQEIMAYISPALNMRRLCLNGIISVITGVFSVITAVFVPITWVISEFTQIKNFSSTLTKPNKT
ncbi:MAG: hypothetical protein IJ973_06355 [Christensenellaceae bacterium]|nr:hypothetical protein [Christensenellaceae bacterium]